MTKWDCLHLCVYISNNSLYPLELLWWDNELTLIGALAVISLNISIIDKILDNM